MVGEVFAGLSAFKTMLDMAKALKDINDAAIRNTAVVELSEKIIAAQVAQLTLIQRVDELEKEVAHFKTWETEKQRYDLKNVGLGALVYVLKPDARGAKPPHWICTNCYGSGRASILLYGPLGKGMGLGWACPFCMTAIEAGTSHAHWADENPKGATP